MINKKYLKEVLFPGLPIAFTLIAQLDISLTDMVLITRYGEIEAGGVSIVLSIYSLVMVFCLGIITALSPRYAMEYAKEAKNKMEFTKLFFNG